MTNSKNKEGRSKTWKLFIAAVLFALMAGIAAMVYLRVLETRLKEKLTPPAKDMVQVVVAVRDLPTGSVVNTSTMAARKVPAEYVNSDVVTPGSFNSIQGAILIKPLGKGKMLTQDYIDLNIPKDFSGTIQLGHRAKTIQVDEINSISGMIRPGNTIDLYTRISARAIPGLANSQSGEVVIPVLENILVLATDKRTARPNEDEFKHLQTRNQRQTYDTITLEVTPKEAALISLAESRGSLIATLRNSKETGGVLFSNIGLADLFTHSSEMLRKALSKEQNRSLDEVTEGGNGKLVTRDGRVIQDPNVRLNKNGLLVTKNGVVLSGRGLVVDKNGRIRTRSGKLVDTASLVPGKDGTLVDKNGVVLDSNGFQTVKGGFLVDKNGRVMTHNGVTLKGVTVGKDGRVRTADGRVLNADEISVDKDGTVRIKGSALADMTVDKDGIVRDADGKPVQAKDLVSIDKKGVVRTLDGRILKGVHLGKDGRLYSADGKELSASDVLLASEGYHKGKNGTILDANGKVLTARDLVTVGKDGKVRTRDGVVLDGVYRDKDDHLRSKDGKRLTAADIVARTELAKAATGKGEVLQGVSGTADTEFDRKIRNVSPDGLQEYLPYEVEYIVGGSSDGAATTFKVRIDEGTGEEKQNK